MLNESLAGRTAGDPPEETQPSQGGYDLEPDDPNQFGPDAPNVREDDPPGGQVVPLAPPVQPSTYPLDHGDFAPDEA